MIFKRKVGKGPGLGCRRGRGFETFRLWIPLSRRVKECGHLFSYHAGGSVLLIQGSEPQPLCPGRTATAGVRAEGRKLWY